MSELNNFTAGTLVTWVSSCSAKIGASYQYILLSDNDKIIIPAMSSGSEISVSVSSSISKDYVPGAYRWFLYEIANGENYQANDGYIDIYPDPMSATSANVTSHNEKMLAAIEAKLEGRLSSDHESYAIDGRQLSRIPFNDLIKLKTKYKWLVHDEQVSKGKRVRKIGVRHQ